MSFFVIQEQIWSAFEQDVAANGILAVMVKRTLDNQIAEVEGKFAAFGDTLAGLWGAAVDAGDLVVTGVLGGDDAQSLYEFVSGSEVGSLTERNNLAKGAVEVATNTAEYVENVASGKKSWQDVAQDAGDAAVSIGTGLYNDYIDPFVKDEKYKQDNLHGGLWTRSVEESYAKGQNEFKKDMVVAEAVLTVYSGGMGTAALKGGKSVAKLDVDAPHGSKKPHANDDSDGGKGRGGPLHGSGKNDMLEGVPLKDGKLKTKAKLLDDVLKELSETIAKFLEKMSEQLNGRLVVIEDATTGQRFFSWEKGEGYSFSKDRTGQGGSHSSGTSKGHDGKATDTDVPSKDMLPKGGKASGDSGHSHHDEPVTDKKGNDANKNQPHEKEKAGAEGTGNSRLPDSMLGKNDADPFRDIYGPGRLSHPEEWDSIIKKAKDAGVEVRILDRDIMAYAPKGNGPGQLNIYENASISALRHEYQHFLDDMAKGYPKLEVTYEFKNRIIMELRAYMVEIKEAERIGNKALAEQLWNNYRAERQYLIDAFGPVSQ
ncbi:hypothetical protein [Brevibacillus parabrevis]|uniref:hypothetical protein n=1 Tax=Brevibacillus parabrevis TaxID=54914 RepID=UPI0028D2DE9B|nr:hypothetical protein [Brevibacillus parabrevis]